MGRLSRYLRDTMGDTRWYHLPIDMCLDWWDDSSISTKYYNCRAFISNLPLFLKLAWNWRCWDSHYTIEVLVSLLKAHAPVIKNGHHVRCEEVYRRCITAAGKLDRAYNRDVDKTIVYLFDKNPRGFESYQMKTTYITDKRIYDGMYKVACRRSDEAEAAAKKEAWEYLSRYVEHFWE